MRVGVAAGLMAMGVVALPALAEPAQQRPAMPALSSEGIARVAILCLVVDPTDARLAVQKRLCEQVRGVAAHDSPVPVAAIGFGDPAILQRDTLGVLVHAAVDRSGGASKVVLSVRPYRTAVESSVLFGATPVVVALDRDGTVPEAAVAAALDQVLPWRMRAAG